MREKEKPSHLGGFLAGLFSGVVLGVLFAPQEGKKTRAKLDEKSKPARTEAKRVAHKAKQSPVFQDVAAVVEKAVGERIDKIGEKYPVLKKEFSLAPKSAHKKRTFKKTKKS